MHLKGLKLEKVYSATPGNVSVTPVTTPCSGGDVRMTPVRHSRGARPPLVKRETLTPSPHPPGPAAR